MMEKEEPEPKGTQVGTQWKNNLGVAKAAFGEGAVSYDEYMVRKKINEGS
jgi:hypothetical protein